MRWKVVILSGVLACAAASGVRAQSTARYQGQYIDPDGGLTVEQAIAMALDNEPSLRAARAEIEMARGRERQAGLRPNPLVSFERRIEPGGTDRQTMASVQWPLELFRRPGRVAVAERERVATELAVEDRQRRLAADVRDAYGAVLAALRDLEVLDEMVASMERQHALLDARVQAGASPSLDRDLVAVELQRWRADRLLQLGTVDAAFVRLTRAVGAAPGMPLKLRHTLEAVVHGQQPADAIGAPAPERRPDVRQAEAVRRIAEARIERARDHGRFDITLFGSYQRMDAGFPQRAYSADGGLTPIRGVFDYVAAGATLTVPLFNRNQGELAAAHAERQAAIASYEAASLDAASEIAAARVMDDRAREGVRILAGEARGQALENLTVVRQSYALGRATVFDVLAEQRRFLDFERAYTGVLRAAYEARTALLEARGDLR